MSRAKPSPGEPVSQLQRVPIRECGEPLVNYLEAIPSIRRDRQRFDYRHESFLRQGVVERLREAASRMPSGIHLSLIEGWRAPHIQRRMYLRIWKQFADRYPEKSDAALRRLVNRYSAPDHPRVPPPHTTGAAFDVFLVDDHGNELDLHSPYEAFDPHCFAMHAEGLSEAAKQNRAILLNAFEGTGITNYPSEYWHWSYGDQGWAYRGHHPHAIYGPVEPEGWQPDPRDNVNLPLHLIDVDDPR